MDANPCPNIAQKVSQYAQTMGTLGFGTRWGLSAIEKCEPIKHLTLKCNCKNLPGFHCFMITLKNLIFVPVCPNVLTHIRKA